MLKLQHYIWFQGLYRFPKPICAPQVWSRMYSMCPCEERKVAGMHTHTWMCKGWLGKKVHEREYLVPSTGTLVAVPKYCRLFFQNEWLWPLFIQQVCWCHFFFQELHVLVIITIFQSFSLLHLLWWSAIMICDYKSLKTEIMVSIF